MSSNTRREVSSKDKLFKVGGVLLATCSILTFIGRVKTHGASRPKVGQKYNNALVLSSGGLLGIAWQLATIERMVAEGVLDLSKYDLRIGTSAGSVANFIISSGLGSQSFKETIKENPLTLNRSEKFLKKPKLTKLLENFKGFKIPYTTILLTHFLAVGQESFSAFTRKIDEVTNNTWPEVETWVVASDQKNGVRVVIDRNFGLTPGGASAASSAVPSLFSPVIFESHHLIDGGVISGTNLDLAFYNTRESITLITISNGFVNPLKEFNIFSFIFACYSNIEEIGVLKYRFLSKIKGINFEVVRPRASERGILADGKFMDDSKMEELIESTLKS